jgi:hypothetical protein
VIHTVVETHEYWNSKDGRIYRIQAVVTFGRRFNVQFVENPVTGHYEPKVHTLPGEPQPEIETLGPICLTPSRRPEPW